jgi:hypothetical protein
MMNKIQTILATVLPIGLLAVIPLALNYDPNTPGAWIIFYIAVAAMFFVAVGEDRHKF